MSPAAGTALPPGQWRRRDHPRFGLPWYAHRAPAADAGLALDVVGPDGAVTRIDRADLDALPSVDQRSDLHCVTTWSRTDLGWSGVRLTEVYDRLIAPRVDPGRTAAYWVFTGLDGYRDESCREDLHAADVLLATHLDGRPLTVDHGAPLRLVAPAHYGYKSVKHVARIELRRRTRRRLPWSSHHPRGRVAREERFLGLPDRAVRVVYRRLVLPPTLWWYRRYERGS